MKRKRIDVNVKVVSTKLVFTTCIPKDSNGIIATYNKNYDKKVVIGTLLSKSDKAKIALNLLFV